ncbi:RluA family pseudouridine synthase [bacterium]|nr:RluA family pseudouridine synthase [bacterium]
MSAQPLVCEFIVESFFRGKRIETFLGKHLRNWSPWRLQRMIQQGCATANDAPIGCDHRVQPGERIRIRLFSPPDRAPVAEDLPVEILYEDPWLVVVNKPPGQIAHPGGDFTGRTLINGLQRHIDQQSPLPGMIRPGIVHRIDRQTSGVMIVPKDHLSHRRLTQQFEERLVSKKYAAIVRGRLTQDTGSIDLPIGKVPNPTCTLMCCKPVAVDARMARTEFRVLERFDEYTFVEARPLTGRHHQIRIHFAEIGHALLADQFYDHFGVIKDGTPIELPADALAADAASRPSRLARSGVSAEDDDEPESEDSPFFDPELPLRRHALHASEIRIQHPISELPMTFKAPLTADFAETLTRLRGTPPRRLS